eukprot:TRINITY_DN6160_c1_g1_i1.p1 TRINITY_DN6160_c1_g1~~TRINITY_DN6160_c1_g1_i1.p1  ORF type:complete len:630 (-),score=118.00 TRINITY_DN6160_c1_g1_i1:39-1928(-)
MLSAVATTAATVVRMEAASWRAATRCCQMKLQRASRAPFAPWRSIRTVRLPVSGGGGSSSSSSTTTSSSYSGGGNNARGIGDDGGYPSAHRSEPRDSIQAGNRRGRGRGLRIGIGGGGGNNASSAMAAAAAAATTAATEFDPNAVFKVLATHSEPYYVMPWSTSPQSTSNASAFALALDGDRFLVTNAHAVHHASVVELQRPGEGTKHLARVVCHGHDCDLALLDVEHDEPFWEGVVPLELNKELPMLNDGVRVCGYPVGGENACITQGVVSRVDLQPYSHGMSSLLAIQIDAAINPGNSGGPAIDSRQRCVGVAFQSFRDGDTENIGYVIPAEVIMQFLRGYKRHGRYVGFGYCGFAWQALDNRAMREALGAPHGGVMIKNVEPLTPAADLLRKRDVLLSIGGKPISSGGTVHFRRRERIAFPYVARRLSPGDVLDMEVLREGAVHKLSFTLTWQSPLVQMHPAQPPDYIVFGGLIFVPLSEPYLRSEWGDGFEERAPVSLVVPWLKNARRVPGEEVVVLSSILGSPLTAGLTHVTNRRLLKCDGRLVRNLVHLGRILDEARGPHVHFELDDDEIIALPLAAAREATPDVMKAHLIPAARSLREVASGEADDLPPSFAAESFQNDVLA